MRKNLLLSLVFQFVFVQILFAQTKPLKLKSGTIIPAANVELFAGDAEPSDAFNDYYYRYLQFASIPTALQQQAIKQTGVQLLQYLPENTFMAAIPTRYDRKLLASFGVVAVVKPNDVQKTCNKLLGDLPVYAVKSKGTVDLDIQHQWNIPSNLALQEAKKLGEILFYNPTNRTLTVRIADNKILETATLSWVFYVTTPSPASTPDDTKGRSLHRSNVIDSDYAGGLHYNGAGVVAGLADDGFVGPHIDFTGRMVNFAAAGGGSHGDMTSGILAGAGNLDPTIRGMASGADLYVYDISGSSPFGSDYPHIRNAINNFTTLGTTITSTSYSQGCNDYTPDTQLGDQLIHDNPQFEFIFSGGNNNGGDCGYGAGGQYGNITGGFKQGKNVIACGNLDALEVIDNSSSRGPASDGRIKPDICANGRGQLSTDGNNTYQVGGGTSAACPSTAGVFAQITQAYKDFNGGVDAPSALLKAALLNSAEDVGNPGPDFIYGWGRVNSRRTLSTLQENRYYTDSISQSGSQLSTITVPPGTNELRVMIYWHDVEGNPASSVYLVNDIDMTVTDPSGAVFNPWILDPTPNVANLSANAVRGNDHLNNVEQVTIQNPTAGTYSINLSGYAIPLGTQKYYVVYEFRSNEITLTYPQGGEGFVPGEVEVLRWDAPKTGSGFTLEYSTNAGSSWNPITTVPSTTLQYQWTIPSTVSGQTLVRVTNGAVSDVSDTLFSIIGLPQNINVDWACPDSVRIVWDAVAGASGYTIYQLGTKYMDVVGTSTTNSFILSPFNPIPETWFSVSAITSTGLNGRRAEAIKKDAGIFACPLALDASLSQIVSPSAGSISDCLDNSNLEVTVKLENRGQNPLTNIPVSYTLNGGTAINEIYTGTIAPFGSVNYTFTVNVNLSVVGSYTLVSWVNYTGDLNIFNDTLVSQINVIAGTVLNVPGSEDFENFTLCSSASDCGATVCTLSNGWRNATNGAGDDVDFRTFSGPTPSTGTGPDVDHTSGTGTGQYVYLETSGGCNAQVAYLESPCVDLTTATAPQLSFWYHMYGASMGSLTVDIFADGAWNTGVIPTISGDQGNTWIKQSVSLAAYVGKIIFIRIVGVTGSDFTSDLAIDDISILETNAPPVINFNASVTTGCVGTTIQLNDISGNVPTSWLWSFSPSTVSFVNGTTATSQNPQVQFGAIGAYTVTLVAGNSFGTDTLTQSNYISIPQAAVAPIVEPFTAGVFPPTNWQFAASTATRQWTAIDNIAGATGTLTSAMNFDNFNYNDPLSEAGIITQTVALTSGANAILNFDVAHARYSATFEDALRVDISTDCGITYVPTGYLKAGTNLATVPDQTSTYIPQTASDWRNETVDLTNWIGNDVIIKFVNINGYGNFIYVDNINITQTVGLDQLSSLGAVKIYPNPSKGMFTLELSTKSLEDLNFSITDIQGRLVSSELVTSKGNLLKQFDLSSNEKGFYFLTINTKEGRQTFKITLL
jgi:PKD repeat protein